MAVHFDPSSHILKTHGKYAGPLAEIEVSNDHWCVVLCRMYEAKKKGNKWTCAEKKELKKKRKRMQLTASKEDRTPDPWFTRPVLCRWAIEADTAGSASIAYSKDIHAESH